MLRRTKSYYLQKRNWINMHTLPMGIEKKDGRWHFLNIGTHPDDHKNIEHHLNECSHHVVRIMESRGFKSGTEALCFKEIRLSDIRSVVAQCILDEIEEHKKTLESNPDHRNYYLPIGMDNLKAIERYCRQEDIGKLWMISIQEMMKKGSRLTSQQCLPGVVIPKKTKMIPKKFMCIGKGAWIELD